MLRLALSLCAVLLLAACGADNIWATDAEISQARYVADEPPSITLFTVINNRTNEGAHSGLMINGSQRVLFDPAGSWYHPSVPERHDMHYGITPRMVSFYIDYHARITYRVIEQTLPVSRETADLLIARAEAYGAVPKAQCTNSVAFILRGVPGFEGLPATWYPKVLSKAFAKLPGVVEKTITDKDADDHHGVLMVQANGLPAS